MLEMDPDDRSTTESTIEELELQIDLRFVSTSNELFEELKKEAKPVLILVNFNSIPLDAIGIITVLKKDRELSLIPTVILGENVSLSIVQEAYRAGANSFIMKPASVTETKQKIKTFFEYWLTVAE